MITMTRAFRHDIWKRILFLLHKLTRRYRWYEEVTFFDGTHDVSPFELLHRMNKSWTCDPGTCGVYASTGFELLGLVLAEAAGVDNWEAYDQKSVIPPNLRDGYPDLTFPGPGPCSLDPLIIHQYGPGYSLRKLKSWGNETAFNVTYLDLYNNSCLNGWTCGNIAAAPSNVARFHYDLHHLRIVSNESLAAMMAFVPTNKGWDPQVCLSRQFIVGLVHHLRFRAAAVRPCDHANISPRRAILDSGSLKHLIHRWACRSKTVTPAHTHVLENDLHPLRYQADYGSIGMLAGYNPRYDFGIAMFTGSANNMNCSMPANMTVDNMAFFYDTLCPLYDEVRPLPRSRS